MANYKLSNEAKEDLIRIHQYGMRQFGIKDFGIAIIGKQDIGKSLL